MNLMLKVKSAKSQTTPAIVLRVTGVWGQDGRSAVNLVFYEGELCRSGESVSLLALDLVPPPSRRK